MYSDYAAYSAPTKRLRAAERREYSLDTRMTPDMIKLEVISDHLRRMHVRNRGKEVHFSSSLHVATMSLRSP